MVTQKETTEASIKSLADYNMKQKPKVEELKATLKSLHTQLNEVRGRYDISRAKLGECYLYTCHSYLPVLFSTLHLDTSYLSILCLCKLALLCDV